MENLVERWSKLNKNALLSAQKLANINTELLMKLAQQQMDMVGIYVEGGNQQVQALSKAKQIQEVLATQYELTSELNKKVVNNARVTMEILVEGKNQFTDWVEEGFQQAVELNSLAK